MKTSSWLKSFLYLLLLCLFFFGHASAQIDISIDRQGVLLRGKFYAAPGEGPFTTIILLHGMPGSESDVLGIGKKLSESAINAITFNYAGTHKSEGQFSFEYTLQDIGAAYEFLHQSENIEKFKIDTANIYLGGYSYGGGMAMTYAANHPEITAVFSIAGGDHGKIMREYLRNPEFAKMLDNMFERLKVPTGPIRFAEGATPKEVAVIGIEALEPTLDLRKSAPLLAQKDILLIGGWDDNSCIMENIVLPLYRALKEAKAQDVKIVAFQDNHAFRNVREELSSVIIEWIKTVFREKKEY
jgi:pimeloyl-ACP methyl ester carboxylesterase